MIATTIEQSKKLIELGLDEKSADMYYFLNPTPAGNIYILNPILLDIGVKKIPEYEKGDIPAWSANALLELIPDMITVDDIGCSLELSRNWVSYEGYDGYDSSYMIQPMIFEKKPFLELLFDTVIWLLEHGHIGECKLEEQMKESAKKAQEADCILHTFKTPEKRYMEFNNEDAIDGDLYLFSGGKLVYIGNSVSGPRKLSFFVRIKNWMQNKKERYF